MVTMVTTSICRSRDEMDPMTRSASIASSYSERQIATMQNKVNKG